MQWKRGQEAEVEEQKLFRTAINIWEGKKDAEDGHQQQAKRKEA